MKNKRKDRTETKHPSFGVIQISRVNGTTNLFRSSLTHQSYIELRICRASVMDVGGGHDPVMPEDQLITIKMSETQFARVITSMNMGAGCPVTLSRVSGERQPPAPQDDRKAFATKAHGNHVDRHRDQLSGLADRLREKQIVRKRPTLKELDEWTQEMSVLAANFASNDAYYRERFQEDIEGIVDEARTELEVHAAATAVRLGMDPTTVPALAAPEPEDDLCGPCQGPDCAGCEYQTPE
jgi:hypothetical protein